MVVFSVETLVAGDIQRIGVEIGTKLLLYWLLSHNI